MYKQIMREAENIEVSFKETNQITQIRHASQIEE